MQYLGGKSRIAKDISGIINQYSEDRLFISLFCGTCSVESMVISKSKTLNDSHLYLIELLKAVQNGYEIPEQITKEEYYRVKSNQDENKALSGFVGFGCSFGAKWWGGYAQNKARTNYAMQSKNSLLRKMNNLKDANILCSDYRTVKIPDGSVVYCDPPYKNTTHYSNSVGFNHEEFWEYMRNISKNNIVFISEISAPEDFTTVWEKPFKRVLDKNKDNIFVSIEKLYQKNIIKPPFYR
jgi:DNA adenine methylase